MLAFAFQGTHDAHPDWLDGPIFMRGKPIDRRSLRSVTRLRAVGPPIAIALAALWMRLHQLALVQARDYDEGVYWESLRAMHAGEALYSEIYYSQPPMFLLSAYPVFAAFGHSLFGARLSCVLFSLLGLLGGYLMGREIAGQRGGWVAMLLMVASLPYLRMSQTLQAEASAIGLALLSIGAMLATRRLTFKRRIFASTSVGFVFALALCCKLLVAASIVPMAACLLAVEKTGSLRARLTSVLAIAFLVGFLVGFAIAIGPFLHELPTVWQQIILLHAQQNRASAGTIYAKLRLLLSAFRSPLTLVALLGTIVALVEGNRVVAVLLTWLVATTLTLALLTPLFPHHLVVLVPPLVALSLLSLAPRTFRREESRAAMIAGKTQKLRNLAILSTALSVVVGLIQANAYYVRDAGLTAGPEYRALTNIINDLNTTTTPDDRVIGDDQFAMAAAGRDTMPWLVDTSFARIHSGHLSLSDAMISTSDSSVGAVLFSTGRLAALPGYRSWVARHFLRLKSLGNGGELWLRSRLIKRVSGSGLRSFH